MFLDVFEVDFVLKIKNNMFALSSIDIKYKTRHCQGENSSIFILKIYKEKFIKKKIVN